MNDSKQLNKLAWTKWLQYRRTQKLPRYKSDQIANRLMLISKSAQRRLIDRAIMQKWQGLIAAPSPKADLFSEGATAKQYEYIKSLSTELGTHVGHIEQLTKSEANKLIKKMNEQIKQIDADVAQQHKADSEALRIDRPDQQAPENKDANPKSVADTLSHFFSDMPTLGSVSDLIAPRPIPVARKEKPSIELTERNISDIEILAEDSGMTPTAWLEYSIAVMLDTRYHKARHQRTGA